MAGTEKSFLITFFEGYKTSTLLKWFFKFQNEFCSTVPISLINDKDA